jgi:hypothetical protein
MPVMENDDDARRNGGKPITRADSHDDVVIEILSVPNSTATDGQLQTGQPTMNLPPDYQPQHVVRFHPPQLLEP